MTFKFPGRGLKWNDAGTFVHLAVVENLEFMAMYYNGRGLEEKGQQSRGHWSISHLRYF